MKRIGILTGGGDCPGLNAAIRAVVRSVHAEGVEVLGFKFGWQGLIATHSERLTLDSVSGILPRGGTILGSSRTNPVEQETSPKAIEKTIKKHQLEGLVVIGGDGTLRGTQELSQKINLPFVAIPKTIDNDLSETDMTFGFDTAVSIATEAIDRLHTTAESHQRVMVIEVMGRDTGWIATCAGMAGGADYILIPEEVRSISDVAKDIKQRHARGKTFSIIVVAEGATLDFGKEVRKVSHEARESVAEVVAHELAQITGYETRVTILGHVQRGGSPTAYDRVLATRFGTHAADLVLQKKFGVMVALKGTEIVSVPLKLAVSKVKKCDLSLYRIAERFFG